MVRARTVRPCVQAASLAFVSAPLVLAAPAEAGPPRILALPYQHLQETLPDELGEQTTVVVTREVGHGGVKVIRRARVETLQKVVPPRRRDPDAPKGNPKAQGRAERHLSRARKAIRKGRFHAAVGEAETAIPLLEDNGGAVADLRLLPEAYLQLAIAHFQDGAEDEANEALQQLVHHDPTRKLNPKSFPAIFVKVFERARYEVLSRRRADVEVRAGPGARVLLNGQSMGIAPILLKNVLPGRHWVRVERPGQSVQARRIDVFAGVNQGLLFRDYEASTSARKDSVLAALRANKLEEGHLEALRRAGIKAKVDFVMLGAVFGTDTAFQVRTGLLDVRTGKIGRSVDIAFDLDLLSAEIEVFKLAEDIQTQAKAGKLRKVSDHGSTWVPAPKFKPRRRARSGARTTAVAAAPRAGPRPRSLYAKLPTRRAQPDGGAQTASPVPVQPRSRLIPKDEMPTVQKSVVPKDERPSRLEVVPKDELSGLGGHSASVSARQAEGEKNDGGPDLWWVWVAVGVLAVSAGTAATVVAVSEQDADQGTVRIRW